MKNKKEGEIKEGQIRILKPFGPSIAKIKMPQILIEKLNDYIDKIIENEKKANKLDIGTKLVGNVTQEFQLEKKISKEIGWLDFLKTGVTSWISFATDKKVTNFELLNTWVVRQFKSEYNPLHWHSGHISGVGYLKAPKFFGETVQKESKTINKNGHLELVHGTRMFLSDSCIDFKPEIGDFYFFPNYMMHSVYPFSGSDEERRSISFNANIDEQIYDVYKN